MEAYRNRMPEILKNKQAPSGLRNLLKKSEEKLAANLQKTRLDIHATHQVRSERVTRAILKNSGSWEVIPWFPDIDKNQEAGEYEKLPIVNLSDMDEEEKTDEGEE